MVPGLEPRCRDARGKLRPVRLGMRAQPTRDLSDTLSRTCCPLVRLSRGAAHVRGLCVADGKPNARMTAPIQLSPDSVLWGPPISSAIRGSLLFPTRVPRDAFDGPPQDGATPAWPSRGQLTAGQARQAHEGSRGGRWRESARSYRDSVGLAGVVRRGACRPCRTMQVCCETAYRNVKTGRFILVQGFL